MRTLTVILAVGFLVTQPALANDKTNTELHHKYATSEKAMGQKPFIFGRTMQRLHPKLLLKAGKQILKIPGALVRIPERTARVVAEIHERGGYKAVADQLGIRGIASLFRTATKLKTGFELTSENARKKEAAQMIDNTGDTRTGARAAGKSMAAPSRKMSTILNAVSLAPATTAAFFLLKRFPNALDYKARMLSDPFVDPSKFTDLAPYYAAAAAVLTVAAVVIRKVALAYGDRARRQEVIGIADRMRDQKALKEFFRTEEDPIAKHAPTKADVHFLQLIANNKWTKRLKKITKAPEVKASTKKDLLNTFQDMINLERKWAEKKSSRTKGWFRNRDRYHDPNNRLPVYESRENAGDYEEGVKDENKRGYLNRLADLEKAVKELQNSGWADE